MAIAYVQGKGGGLISTSVQSVTVTIDNPTAIHNLLIATVSTKHAGTTFTPPTGWAQQLSVNAQAQTETYFTYVDNPGSLTSFAFTMTDTADGMSATVAEFSGMGTTLSVDKTATANSASSTAMDSGTTATTTSANELWYGALAYGSGSTKTISGVTNGFTAPAALIADSTIAGNAHGAHISNYYKIPGVTGTADVGATLSSASTNIGLMICLISTASSTNTRTVPATAALQATLTRTIPATTALQSTLTRSVPSTAALQATLTRTVPSSAALLATLSRPVPTSAALQSLGLVRTVPASAALLSTNIRTVPTQAALLATLARVIPVTAALSGSVFYGTGSLSDARLNPALLADVALNRVGTTDTALSAAILADKAG